MKAFVHRIAAVLLFAACCTDAAKGNGMETSSMVDIVGSDYTANATAIEKKKQEMLAVADSVGHFWFSDDTEFQSQDPHAYWLMNRMMQMVQLVQTADDDDFSFYEEFKRNYNYSCYAVYSDEASGTTDNRKGYQEAFTFFLFSHLQNL